MTAFIIRQTEIDFFIFTSMKYVQPAQPAGLPGKISMKIFVILRCQVNAFFKTSTVTSSSFETWWPSLSLCQSFTLLAEPVLRPGCLFEAYTLEMEPGGTAVSVVTCNHIPLFRSIANAELQFLIGHRLHFIFSITVTPGIPLSQCLILSCKPARNQFWQHR